MIYSDKYQNSKVRSVEAPNKKSLFGWDWNISKNNRLSMTGAAKAVATVFGVGYSPIAPGTVGSIFGCLIVYIISLFVEINPVVLLAAIALAYAIGFWATKQLETLWPHDDNRIVIDEALGIFVSLLFLPYSPKLLICALVIFRIFDIFKPLGIRRIDNFHSGHAVMFDDILAGIYTNIVLQIIFRWGMVTL